MDLLMQRMSLLLLLPGILILGCQGEDGRRNEASVASSSAPSGTTPFENRVGLLVLADSDMKCGALLLSEDEVITSTTCVKGTEFDNDIVENVEFDFGGQKESGELTQLAKGDGSELVLYKFKAHIFTRRIRLPRIPAPRIPIPNIPDGGLSDKLKELASSINPENWKDQIANSVAKATAPLVAKDAEDGGWTKNSCRAVGAGAILLPAAAFIAPACGSFAFITAGIGVPACTTAVSAAVVEATCIQLCENKSLSDCR